MAFADVDSAMRWMAMDVEINAQGLASWLDRASRGQVSSQG